MRHIRRRSAFFATLTVIALSAGNACPAYAQNQPGAPGPATPQGGSTSTPKGLAKVVAGVKAYRAGKMDAAITTLTIATSSGGLSSKDLAKALYYRGLAYRRKQKPAEAIADLTSAIWLKGGLSQTERDDAVKNRTAAYREAGVQDAGADIKRSAGPPRTSPAASPASAPTNAPGTWKTATRSQTGSTTPAQAPAAAPTKPPASSTGGVGAFFTNLFGGGTPAAKAPAPALNATLTPAPIPAGSAAATARTALETPATGPVSAISGWNSKTQVSTQNPTKQKVAVLSPQKPKPAPRAKPAPPAKPVLSGKYTVRVAAVRSRDKARQVVTTLQTKHEQALSGRDPVIVPQSFGNMGTFYNVHVGPFAQAKDYKALCTAARANGYDCHVLKK